jgi:hypothetical protein
MHLSQLLTAIGRAAGENIELSQIGAHDGKVLHIPILIGGLLEQASGFRASLIKPVSSSAAQNLMLPSNLSSR